MRNIYFAGPITGLTYDSATDWRMKWQQDYEDAGWRVLSPMRGKEHLQHSGVLTGVFDEGKAAVCRDENDIRKSEVVLVNFLDADRVSIGTCCEIGLAHALNKHIVTVMTDPSIDSKGGIGKSKSRKNTNPHDHIFILEWSSIVLPTMEAAFEWIRRI